MGDGFLNERHLGSPRARLVETPSTLAKLASFPRPLPAVERNVSAGRACFTSRPHDRGVSCLGRMARRRCPQSDDLCRGRAGRAGRRGSPLGIGSALARARTKTGRQAGPCGYGLHRQLVELGVERQSSWPLPTTFSAGFDRCVFR